MSHRTVCSFSLSVILAVFTSFASAAIQDEWIGEYQGPNLWNNGDNWAGFLAPIATHEAMIDVADPNYACNIDTGVNATALTVYVGFYREAYLNIKGGTLTTPRIQAGTGMGTGFVNMSGGLATLTSDSVIGQAQSDDGHHGEGIFTMTGGTVKQNAGVFFVGYGKGYGTLNIENGIFNVASLRAGYDGNSIGDVNIIGGKVNVKGDISLGQFAQSLGTLTIAGGEVNQPSGYFYVGYDSTGQSLLDIQGGTILTNSLRTGPNAVADINISDGYIKVAGDPVLGWNPLGKGTLNMTGGTLFHNSGWFYLGFSGGTGLINLNGGTLSTPFIQWPSDSAKACIDIAGGTLEIRRNDPAALEDITFQYVAYLAPRGMAKAYGGQGQFKITKDPSTGYILVSATHLRTDRNFDGIIDLHDFAIFAENWDGSSNQVALADLAAEWLMSE